MDILLCVYVIVGMLYCFSISEDDFNRSNFLFLFKKPTNIFNMVCMVIFNPVVLVLVALSIVGILLAYIFIFVVAMPVFFIKNVVIESDIFKNAKHNRLYKFLFNERIRK